MCSLALQLLSITPRTASSSVSPSRRATRLQHSTVLAQSGCRDPGQGMGAVWEREPWQILARPPRCGTEAMPLQLVTPSSSGSRACAVRQQRRLKANFYGCLVHTGNWLLPLALKSCPESTDICLASSVSVNCCAAWEGSGSTLPPPSPAQPTATPGCWGRICPYLLRLNQLELHAPASPGDEVSIGGVIQ